MKRRVSVILVMTVGMLLPKGIQAQDSGNWADSIQSLHSVLDKIYEEMIPLCSQLIGVGSGLAGFAALFFIASRVWGHLSRAEPIDFYPLFRPFVIGFCVLNFTLVIAMINGVMQPTVTATSAMVDNSNKAVAALLKQKEAAIKASDVWQMYVGETGEGDSDKWYKYTHPEDPGRDNEGVFEGIGNEMKFALAKASYNFRNAIKEVIAEILQLLFAAASLCINTIRTFNLIILAILGPLVFGISVFDGFQHTVRQWIARYLNIFLWLPLANIFGAIIGNIQENMLRIDVTQIGEQGDTFFSRTDAGYMIFLLIGIIGYTTIPSMANYIVFAGGGGLTHRATGMAMGTAGVAGTAAVSAGATAVSSVGAGVSNLGHAPGDIYRGYQSAGRDHTYLNNKLSGK